MASNRGKMLISVIIATYGDRWWEQLALERAFPSAHDQGAHEIIVGHDDRLAIGPVRNILAEKASGDWLCFLDADDELAPGYLGAMERALEQEEGASPRTTALLLTPAVSYVRKNRAALPKFNDRGIPLSQDNWLVLGTLISRDLFMRIGGFSDYPHGFEDFSLWNKAWQMGAKIVKVPDAVYRAYVNPHSKHRLGWRNRQWQVATHERVVRELKKWGEANGALVG